MVHEYWVTNSCVSPNTMDGLWQRITQNQYENHENHTLEMTQIELFRQFKEEHNGVNISINTFVQQKPWYVKPTTFHDTFCCRYHVEFELYYDTFLNFCKTFWAHSPPPSTIHDFISQILCEEKVMNHFTKKKIVGGKKCDHCGNITLFYSKYPIDMNHQSLSNIKFIWKRYGYINAYIATSFLNVISRRIDLWEDRICVIDFLKKFEKEIYKYTKHSHRAQWKDLQFI